MFHFSIAGPLFELEAQAPGRSHEPLFVAHVADTDDGVLEPLQVGAVLAVDAAHHVFVFVTGHWAISFVR